MPTSQNPVRAGEVVHGSPDGFEQGCRSRGGCANGPTSAFLSCVEAHIAHHSDRALGRWLTSRRVPRQPSGAALRDSDRVSRGSGARRVDPRPALDCLDELQRAGFTLRQIAIASGLGRATVSALARQYREEGPDGVAMSEGTSSALLAIDVMAAAGGTR